MLRSDGDSTVNSLGPGRTLFLFIYCIQVLVDSELCPGRILIPPIDCPTVVLGPNVDHLQEALRAAVEAGGQYGIGHWIHELIYGFFNAPGVDTLLSRVLRDLTIGHMEVQRKLT